MPRLANDTKLLSGFREGDRKALEQVYNEYSGLIFSLLKKGFVFSTAKGLMHFRGFTDRFELENAVQEVFVRVFSDKARMSYDGTRPFGRYLAAIARNLVHDMFRRKENMFVPLDQGHIEAFPSMDSSQDQVDPDHAARDSELHQKVEQFIAGLHGLERQVFELRFRLGLSIGRVATELEVTEHRVKAVERKIKKRFFLAMKKHGYFEGYRLGSKGVVRVVTGMCLCVLVLP